MRRLLDAETTVCVVPGGLLRLAQSWRRHDGPTTFVDDVAEYPLFGHDGREAVRAYNVICNDGMEFVGHLARHTPEAKAALEATQNAGAQGDMELQRHCMLRREVRCPGDVGWRGSRDPEHNEISTPMCRDGMQPQSVGP